MASAILYRSSRRLTDEEALINEYASWKEELTKKEQELNEREKIFEGMADKELNSEIKAGEEKNGESQNSGS